MKVHTNEPIKIDVSETRCGMIIITLDDIEYAHFNDASLDEINLERLKYWIEETYYDNSYKSSAYVSCPLQLSEFKDDGKRHAYIEGIEFCLTKEDASYVSQQGQCDEYVTDVSNEPYIIDQLAKISDEKLKEALCSYGFEDDCLNGRQDNEERLIWLAGGQINDEEIELT